MKKTTKKLVVSTLALGLASTTTVGSAFAWFTVNSQAHVSGIAMNVKSENDLRIALDGQDTTWQSSLNLAKVFSKNGQTLDSQTIDKTVFTPSSSVDGVNFHALSPDLFNFGVANYHYNGDDYTTRAEADAAVLVDGGNKEDVVVTAEDTFDYRSTYSLISILSGEDGVVAELGYVEFVVHFAVMGDTPIRLNPSLYDVKSDAPSGSADALEVVRVSTQKVSRIANPNFGKTVADRWADLEAEEVPYGTDVTSEYVFAPALVNENPVDATIYRVTPQLETNDLALYSFNDVYSYTDIRDSDTEPSILNIVNKGAGLAGLDGLTTEEVNTFFSNDNIFSDFSFEALNETSPLFKTASDTTPVSAGIGYTYESYAFRVWFEGNDNSCLNSIFNQTISMSFVFTNQ